MAGNGPDYAVALYGALAAGAAVESANPALKAPELTHHFGIGQAPSSCSPTSSRDAAVGEASGGPVSGSTRLGTLLAAPRPRPAGRASGRSGAAVPVQRHDRAAEARGAHPRQHDRVPGRVHLRADGRLAPTDVVAVAMPFPHLFGTAILTHALRNGASVVTLPAFELEPFLRAARTTTPSTVVPATPPLVAALARHPLIDRLDLVGAAARDRRAPRRARPSCRTRSRRGSAAWSATTSASPRRGASRRRRTRWSAARSAGSRPTSRR